MVVRYRGVTKEKSPDFRPPGVGISVPSFENLMTSAQESGPWKNIDFVLRINKKSLHSKFE